MMKTTAILMILVATMMIGAAMEPVQLSGLNKNVAKNIASMNDLNWTIVTNMSQGNMASEITVRAIGPWANESSILDWDELPISGKP
jgi:hypothetical protein